MKYTILTFGCRVNQADSLGFEEDLLTCGAEAVPPEDADLVIVNTCSVTASADQAARQAIRRLSRINPSARIVVTGCYATRRADEVRDLPNVSRVIPNEDKPRLVALTVGRPSPRRDDGLRPAHDETTTAERFGSGDGGCGSVVEPGVAGRTAYTLRVQTGCAQPCSYCIIPMTRGEPRSVPLIRVLDEVRQVRAAGFKEIALTGVHLGSYGRDLRPALSLTDLLVALASGADAACDGSPLFRISSLEPMDCTADIVGLVERSRCFAPHFHLPLQHASDCVLAAMRRPYTLDYYAGLVDSIRSRIPHASIGSDVIVGFPSESEDDFERLASYLECSPLTHVHVFPYSDRPGTRAAAMKGRVPGVIVRERARRLREISQRLSQRFRERQIGTVHQALTLEDGALAVTGNYLKLRIPPGRTRNEWVKVRMISEHDGELLGG